MKTETIVFIVAICLFALYKVFMYYVNKNENMTITTNSDELKFIQENFVGTPVFHENGKVSMLGVRKRYQKAPAIKK